MNNLRINSGRVQADDDVSDNKEELVQPRNTIHTQSQSSAPSELPKLAAVVKLHRFDTLRNVCKLIPTRGNKLSGNTQSLEDMRKFNIQTLGITCAAF